MAKTVDTLAFLRLLLKCHSRRQVIDALRPLGDDENVGLEESFGPYAARWIPFGGNASNISTIGLGTKPGKSLTERLTNAIDALLEERAQQTKGELPDSPRRAAEEWFGRPMSGPDSGLFLGLPAAVDKRISVVMLDSGVEEAPTIDVLDLGVGIPPGELQGTILSLQAGNKIRKKHQIGAFGQGGSSTLGFSDFVLIASRSRSTPGVIGFTVIRVMKLDATYKEDCYAYLTGDDGQPFVATLDAPDAPLPIYEPHGKVNLSELTKGTLVRHIGYRLSSVSKALAPSPGNLYHYLHYSLFDPLLPFRIYDLRTQGSERSEYIGGSRNRLMRAAGRQQDSSEGGGNNIQVKHYRPMEYIVPSGADVPCIGIEYWVVLAFRKGKDGEEDLVLRSNSAELYVQPNHPIVGTLNGQTQGELTGQMFKEIGLGLLARHVIVHIDASAADSRVRRELFATSREGFKEGPVLESIISSLKRMLEEDEELEKVEAELTERLARRDTATTRDEVRQQVTRLLKDAGLQVSETAKLDVRGSGQHRITPREKRTPYRRRDPLPTLPFPNATFLRFASPDQHLEVHLQDSELVLVETDADAEFDRRGLIGISSTDDLLEVESKANLSGGRVRWRLRPASKATAGAVGELRAFLTKPNGSQLSASISFEVLAPRERPSKQGKTVVPPFEIQRIHPRDEEQWGMLWPNDGADDDRQKRHAYISDQHGGKTWVYYSEVFPPFASTLEKLAATKPDLVQAFTTAYEVWIAYHAILQSQAGTEQAIEVADDEKLDELLDQQRSVVAMMQVKQSLQYAEMWKKSLTSATPD